MAAPIHGTGVTRGATGRMFLCSCGGCSCSTCESCFFVINAPSVAIGLSLRPVLLQRPKASDYPARNKHRPLRLAGVVWTPTIHFVFCNGDALWLSARPGVTVTVLHSWRTQCSNHSPGFPGVIINGTAGLLCFHPFTPFAQYYDDAA